MDKPLEERDFMKNIVRTGGTLTSPIHSVQGAFTTSIVSVGLGDPYGKMQRGKKNTDKQAVVDCRRNVDSLRIWEGVLLAVFFIVLWIAQLIFIV